MNMQATQTGVQPPPPPSRIEDMRLPVVMMRDIMLKTVFRVDGRIEASPYHARPHIHFMR